MKYVTSVFALFATLTLSAAPAACRSISARRRPGDGFTLIELLVVSAIIAILAWTVGRSASQ